MRELSEAVMNQSLDKLAGVLVQQYRRQGAIAMGAPTASTRMGCCPGERSRDLKCLARTVGAWPAPGGGYQPRATTSPSP
jgi:hypothetical protein